MNQTDMIALEAIKLMRIGIWPVVIILALLLFHAPLTRLIDRLQSFKAEKTDSGFNIAFAAASLASAEVVRGGNTPASATDLASVVNLAEQQITNVLTKPRVLWVDDNPDNNIHERTALSALGVQFSLAESTNDAKTILSANAFDLIISDFRRDKDPEARYALLDYVMTLRPHPPYIIYASSAEPAFIQEAKEHGAFGETNRPYELFGLVVAALQRGYSQH